MMRWVEKRVEDHHAGVWRARPRVPLELLVVSEEDWLQLVREVEAVGRREPGELAEAVELTFRVAVQAEVVRVRPVGVGFLGARLGGEPRAAAPAEDLGRRTGGELRGPDGVG